MSDAPKVGEIFEDKYEIESVLGSGGIGTVYKAQQLDAQRLIALKVLHQDTAVDEEYRARFVREAQTLNKLSHANVVTVYHLGISETGLPYIAMEFVQGKSVRSMINESERLSVVQSLKIIADAARAMYYVHSEGITHRDLKPDNILITQKPEPDTVKLVDFGLVSLKQQKEQKLTSTGQLIGTVSYMSPEQCLGKPVDFRSDIYSLCASLYEMLSGSSPFYADNAIGMMYKHTNEAVPKLDTDKLELFHPGINEVIAKGMAKDPARRFSNMDELANEIERIIGLLTTPSKRNTKLQLLSTSLSVALILILGVAAGLSVFIPHRKPPKIKAKSTINAATQQATDQQEKYLREGLAGLERHYGSKTPKIFESLMELCDYLVLHSKYTEAEPLAMRAFDLIRNTNRSEDIMRVTIAMASCLQHSDKQQDAVRVLKQALADSNLAARNRFRLQAMTLLAQCLDVQGHTKEAISIAKQLILSREESGQKTGALDYDLTFLAQCYQHVGDLSASEATFRKALQHLDKEPEAQSQYISEAALEVATFCMQQDRNSEAEQLLRHVMAAHAEVLRISGADEHLQTKLAESLARQGKYDEAKTILKSIISKQLQRKNTYVDVAELNKALIVLGQTYSLEKKNDEMERYLKELLAKQPALTNQLTDCLMQSGNFAEATALCEQMLGNEKKSHNTKDFPASLSALQHCYSARGKDADFEAVCLTYLKQDQLSHTEDLNTVAILEKLSQVYEQQARNSEMLSALQRALDMRKRLSGPEDFEVIQKTIALADWYRNVQHYKQAEQLLHEALSTCEKSKLTEARVRLSILQMCLARVYGTSGRWTEAESAYKKSIELGEKAFDKGNEQLQQEQLELADCYQNEHKDEESKALLQEMLSAERASHKSSLRECSILIHLGGQALHAGVKEEAQAAAKNALSICDKHANESAARDWRLWALELLVLSSDNPGAARVSFVNPRVNSNAPIELHIAVIDTLVFVASTLREQTKYADAVDILQAALEVAENGKKVGGRKLSQILSVQKDCFERQGNHKQAEIILKRMLELEQNAKDKSKGS